jgi:5S rRNA maturation endonuclease (ribonuclease M5)
MKADFIARALGARRVGTTWMAKCPAHDDHNPSLAITEKNGEVLLRCHAGCSQPDVIEALRNLGLWGSPESQADHRIVETYDYTDETGTMLYQIVRYEPKAFHQRRPDRGGGWIWKKSPRQVLYHLPEVIEAPIVFVVEGEKDVETLRAAGFVATTNAGGAEAPWLPSFSETLRGREVILIPDDDEPGRRRVIRIARALVGQVAKLIVLELEGAKDLTDWFGQGHGELELIAMVESQNVCE